MIWSFYDFGFFSIKIYNRIRYLTSILIQHESSSISENTRKQKHHGFEKVTIIQVFCISNIFVKRSGILTKITVKKQKNHFIFKYYKSCEI